MVPNAVGGGRIDHTARTVEPRGRDRNASFVGRAAEIEQLQHGLTDASAGDGRLFMIAGEPGIGKTRLLDELALRAPQQGMRVLWGRCWESGGAPAYWPWVQIVRAYASQIDAATLVAQLSAAPDLVHIVPELRSRLPQVHDMALLEPEQARFRVLDATASFLRNAAASQPLGLLLDDLHAADRPSLLLLRFLARELRGTSLLVVGTFRATEAARDPAVAEILAEVTREGQRIPLGGLSRADVASYIAAAAPRRVAPATADAVYAATEGNPLFLTEVVRLWAAEPRHDAAAEIPAAEVSIPEELRAAIRQRLAPLSEAVRRLLMVAAVLGREFDVPLVERVLDATDSSAAATTGAVLESVDAARAAGVVQAVANVVGRFRFAHVLIRDVLYESLPSSERANLHRRFGAALERMHTANLAPYLAEIAHHYAQAATDGDVDKAVEFARRAGDRALALVAYEDAAGHFERALHALPQRRGGPLPADRALHCELLLSLGDALWGAGDVLRMRETFQRAAETARAMEATRGAPLLARAALGCGGRQQRAHLVFDVEVVQLLEAAREALDEDDSALRARVLARLAYALYTQAGSYPRRAQLSRQAVQMARRVGDPATLRWVLNDWRWALWGPDTIEERLEIGAELVQLAERVGDTEMVLGEHAWRLVDLLELGDIAAVDAELDTYTRIARQQPRPWFEWYVRRFSAMRALLEGRFAEAERLGEEALAALKRTEHQDAFLIYGIQMLAIRAEQGRLVELESGLQAFVAQYPAVGIWRYVLAFLQAELDRPAATRTELERSAARDFADLPADYLRLAAAAYLTEACAFVNDAPRAALLYDVLRPYAKRCVVVGFGMVCLGSVSRYLGMLAATTGRRDAAAAHFETALAENARLRARPALARSQYAYAQMLLGVSQNAAPACSAAEREQAWRLLRAANATAGELGMHGLQARVVALGARVGLPLDADADGAEDHPPQETAPPAARLVCRLHQEGDYWTIRFAEQIFRMKHLRGLAYLAHLLRRPGEEVHVFDLLDLAEGVAMDRSLLRQRDSGDAGPVIDAAARAAYKERLRDLREDLGEAEAANDLGRAERCREEIAVLAEHVSAATGLGGRDRRPTSQANRARVAVSKAIRVALGRIDEHSSSLAQHLDLAIKTGTFCCYTPDPLHPVQWDLD